MDDLESFFWVLFWICIHHNGCGQERVVFAFDEWNDAGTEKLANLKKGVISDKRDFVRTTKSNFTSYYRPLIPWANKLRRVVFPNGRRWQQVDDKLYSQMRQILNDAQNDPQV
ncbi:hypothetical protein F4803DRAFT_573786 [Xylaria telfairii]|nr:hypothetical protein F4803DRAFT_573786 [Xylaria telfairii]